MIKNKNEDLAQIIISWIVVFLWMMFIFYLSSQVAEESNELSTGITEVIVEAVEKVVPELDFDIESFNHIIRKNAHLFAYLILGALLMNAFRKSRIKGLWSYISAFAFCVLYAISDEVHQLFVPGRGGQARDVLIDGIGAAVGIWFYCLLYRIKAKIMNGKMKSTKAVSKGKDFFLRTK